MKQTLFLLLALLVGSALCAQTQTVVEAIDTTGGKVSLVTITTYTQPADSLTLENRVASAQKQLDYWTGEVARLEALLNTFKSGGRAPRSMVAPPEPPRRAKPPAAKSRTAPKKGGGQ